DCAHDRRKGLGPDTPIMAMIGLGVIAQARKLPGTQPIDGSRQSPTVLARSRVLVAAVTVLPERNELGEIGDQSLDLGSSDEPGQIREAGPFDRRATVMGRAAHARQSCHDPWLRAHRSRTKAIAAAAAACRCRSCSSPDRARGTKRWLPSR